MPTSELDDARGLAACCSRAGAFCGDGLLAKVEQLVADRARLVGELDEANRKIAALTATHTELRRAVAQSRAWSDGVTGKRMAYADELLDALDADAPRLRAALSAVDAPEEQR